MITIIKIRLNILALIRSIIRLPMVLILDLIKFDFRKAIKRIPEILVNCIDLISGDQIKVIAVKK